MAGTTAKKEILDPLLKELNLSSFDYANYSKRDTDLVTDAVKKTISVSLKQVPFTTGDPQIGLNDGDIAVVQTGKLKGFDKFEVGFQQIQTEPTVIPKISQEVAAIDVYAGTFNTHVQTLGNQYGNFVCKQWTIKPFSPDSDIDTTAANFETGKYKNHFLLTTGGTRKSALHSTPTDVKKISFDDLVRVQKSFSERNMTTKRKYALITPTMLADIQKLPEMAFNFSGMTYDPFGNQIVEYFGIIFIVRGGGDFSTNCIYQNLAGKYLPLPFGSMVTSISRDAALFWAENEVVSSGLNLDLFESKNDPNFYGGSLDMQARFCAYKANELTQDGVVVLVEADPA